MTNIASYFSSSFQFSSLVISCIVIIQIISSGAQIVVTNFEEDLPLFDPASGTPYKNCGGSSELKSVKVIPCNLGDGDHCVITRGSNVTFKMSFVSEEYTKTLQTKIYGIIEYIPIPFPCPQPNACKNSGIQCPLVKGIMYNYTISAPVLKKYPKTSLWIKGELKDDNGNSVACVEIPVKVE